ncbi:MAG: hypothetical protein Crog4KO_00530 [Crocinitomicaceae bacterium]
MTVKTNFFILSLLLIVMATSCEKQKAPYPADEPLVFYPINLRVENISPLNFLSVEINPGSEDHQYGALNAGDTSNYYYFQNGGYHYGSVEIVTEDYDTFRLTPIDYVGETPLSQGNYTYILNLDTSAIAIPLTLDFRVD